MSHLIEIAFKGNRKEFFLWDGDDPPPGKAAVIVEGDRGEDLGRVHATGENAERRFAGVAHGVAVYGGGNAMPTKRALRLATEEDEKRVEELTEQNESARRKAIERVKAHGLVMKVSDAEWQWDRRKLTLYFTAEKRVDFRALVRDLAALFRTRIELKQIGVRDEAKRLDGVGRCGREYCSSSWLPELRPVNLSVAKDQHLSLNPTQISGACGRLMCSLRYEHEFYVQARKRFPKEGKVLVTTRGEEKVIANDIFRDRVTLRGLDGESRIVALADLRREMTSDAADARESAATTVVDAPDAESASDAVPNADRRRAERRRAPTDPPSLPTVVERTPAPRAESLPIIEDVADDPVEGVDVLDDEMDGEDDADGGDGGDSAIDGSTDGGTSPDGTPMRPRRRRGRRGGRRGRGGSGGSGSAGPGGTPPAAPPPND